MIKNAGGGNSCIEIRGMAAQTRVNTVSRRRFVTTAIENLNGGVGAARLEINDTNIIIANGGGRRHARGNSQIKKTVAIFDFAVGH
jgi:hypothetical protein